MIIYLIPLGSRDDKRYTEKKNKSERARRKKEDITKLRNLVDMTLRCFRVDDITLLFLTLYSLDPRIKRIKQQEKEAREAKKRGTTSATVKKTKEEIEEEKRKAEHEAKQKEEAEKVCIDLKFFIAGGNLWCSQVARAEAKKQKAAAANAAKKARRQQRAAEDASQ